MSFLKKFVNRSRSNSYVEDDYDRDQETSGGQEPRNYDPNRPPSSWKKYDDAQQYQDQAGGPSPTSPYERQQRGVDGSNDSKMYSQEPQHQQQMPFRGPRNSNNSGMVTGRSSRDGFVDVPSMNQTLPPSVSGTGNSKMINNTAAPDLLTQAFNAALHPFTEKISGLEEQVADLQAFVDQLEKERLDIFAWIDKRGLRPGTLLSSNRPSNANRSHKLTDTRSPTHNSKSNRYSSRHLKHRLRRHPKRPTRPQNHNRKLRSAPPAR